MSAVCEVRLGAGWIGGHELDNALRVAPSPHDEGVERVVVVASAGCNVMMDAAVRLLCLTNHVVAKGRFVHMVFEDGMPGTMGYLDRVGFFDLLGCRVTMDPEPPGVSGAVLRQGANRGLVEIQRIPPEGCDPAVPGLLADRIAEAREGSADQGALNHAAFTVFAELIQNIQQHSGTTLDGYAALQVYAKGGKARVVVSDSGVGMLNTLRPGLKTSRHGRLSDTDLIVHLFRAGLSRHGERRGCGLPTCAVQAIKYRAQLTVRLDRCSVLLVPGDTGYRPNVAYCSSDLPPQAGTHICFDFLLDKGPPVLL